MPNSANGFDSITAFSRMDFDGATNKSLFVGSAAASFANEFGLLNMLDVLLKVVAQEIR